MKNSLRAVALGWACGWILIGTAAAADIEPAKKEMVDKFGVNMANGQVTHSLDTISIGGATGLAHSVSVNANEFNYLGYRGFQDKFYAKSRFVELSTEPNYSPRKVLRVHDFSDSADFKILVNGVLCQSVCNQTTGYTYVAIGDKRHTLEKNGAYTDWTKPDGTIVRFGGGPNASNIGLMRQVIHPNGFTLTMTATNSVQTNTGFQLKYLYVPDNLPMSKGDNPNLVNAPPAGSSASSGWSGINPKYIVGLNNAVEYCAPDAATCALSNAWPTVTFEWPTGMPRSIYIGGSLVNIYDAMGRKTAYRFDAQDLAISETGAVISPYIAGREFSPRLVGVKTANANSENLVYTYRNVFQTVGTEFGWYDIRLQTAGLTRSATSNAASASYNRAPAGFPGIFDSNSGGPGGVAKVRPNPNINGNPSALEFVDTEDGRLTFEPTAIRNFRTSWEPFSGPREDYEYTRHNMTRVVYRRNQSDQTEMLAEFPASCTPGTRKTCNQAIRIRDARGNWTDYTYHAASGQVASITYPPNKHGIRAQTRFEYQQKSANYYQDVGAKAAGAPIWLKTAEKSCINSGYSAGACAGNDEIVAAFEYEHDNLLMTGMTVTAPGGATLRTCFRYDRYGNQIGKTEPNANLASCPSSAGLQTEVPYTTATRYNLAGEVTGTIAPDPDAGGVLRLLATRTTYGGDARALLVKVESGELQSFPSEDVPVSSWGGHGFTVFITKEFAYDSYGRKIRETVRGSDGAVETLVQLSYDLLNRVSCKAVRMNKALFASPPADACVPGAEGTEGPDRIIRYTYDGLDQVVTEKRGVGTPLEQTYVSNEYNHRLLRFQTDANGNKTELQYDNYGRLKKRVYPHPTSIGGVNANDYNEYGYDANGNVTFDRKRNGTSIFYQFDNNNRPIFKNLSSNTYTPDVVFDYDLRGLALSTRFGASAMDASGAGITNVFNAFGRLQHSTNSTGGFTRTISYLHDNNGNRTRVTHPDGNYFQYAFDGSNRVTGLLENAAGNLLTVNYRPNGQRLSIVRANGATTTITPDTVKRLESFNQEFAGTAYDLTNSFTYNATNQVTRRVESNSRYQYLGNENRSGNYVPNGLNQYTSVDGLPLTYDANGNLAGDGSQGFTYDMENRLVQTSGPGATLRYDPLGRLIEVKIGTAAATQFLYDGDALIGEYTINGGSQTLLRRYVHGDQVDEPWVQYNGSTLAAAQRRYLHADHQGSVIAHSNSTGAVPNALQYDGFGVPGPANVDRFGYTGQMWIRELGLNYYKARMYSPKLGRFLQTDPIFYVDDMNIYAYAGNDPVNNIDPSGSAGVPLGPISTKDIVPMTFREAVSLAADFTPIVGDIKGIVEAFQNPTGVNITAAVIGLVPGVGDVAGKALKTGSNILENAANGARRHREGLSQIAAANPGKTVQSETYLRTADGKRALDPLTGEGRRVDAAVLDTNAKTGQTHEITGPDVNKTAQSAKENRILENGGTYVRDRQTGELCKVAGACQRTNIP